MANPVSKSPQRVDAAAVNGLCADYWARNYTDERLNEYAARFAAEHVVVLSDLCPPELLEPLRAEACDIIDRHGTTHRLSFAITDNTPRNMTTVGQPIIKDEGPLIDAFYFAPELLRLSSASSASLCTRAPTRASTTSSAAWPSSGDTHGWHWDDYTYGIILVLEAPDYRDGGFVQAVAATSWDKREPRRVRGAAQRVVRSYALQARRRVPGQDRHDHASRATRSAATSRRTIVNMTLASTADLEPADDARDQRHSVRRRAPDRHAVTRRR